MDKGNRSLRNEIFQELKPKCVELSQLALRDEATSNSFKPLVESTARLLATLESKCQRSDGIFDEKLADYVFFPLAQVLRRKQTYADQLSELTIRCIRILLEYGWRDSIAPELAKQLLILLTFVGGGVPGKEKTAPAEELMEETYRALAALFKDLGKTSGGAATVVEPGTIPALGHCVTVLLEGAINGPSAVVQLQALLALNEVWHCVKDPYALSSFLPGTVSGLTKCLMPSTSMRRSRKILIKALEVLSHVLVSSLSDLCTRNIKINSLRDSKDQILSAPWLKATSGQVKLALSNVIRLRSHESVEVRKALNDFCLTVLDECHDTLIESSSILVETCMALNGINSSDGMSDATSLTALASIHADVNELIKCTVYNWVNSLPRVMQGNDEAAKDSGFDQLSKSLDLVASLALDSTVLNEALGKSLRDSITVALGPHTNRERIQEAELDLNSQAAMISGGDSSPSFEFQPLIMPKESQKNVRKNLMSLIFTLGTRGSQVKMASEMLEYARNASGPSMLSAYWLSFQILKSSSLSNKYLDEFVVSSFSLSDDQEAFNQELFSYSLSLLTHTDNEDVVDWRMQAVALEIMADTAERLKNGFRIELVDTLYPVVQFLGSSVQRLREHAIACLNIFARSCGYRNVSELIIDNVDYMVNAVSIRLNMFDIAPQAPQVLVMMIRLAGPSLLLYLDDVVDSIFAALDNFHGYPHLVDMLFGVLGEIVTAGSKSNQLAITLGEPSTINHRKKRPVSYTIDEIISFISPRAESESEPLKHKLFPRTPWKSADMLLNHSLDEPLFDQEDQHGPLETEKKPTRTYKILQSITRLSQHYLTSSSSTLRSRLLGLISTSSKGLYTDEAGFLPLVNDIWPVVVRRLYDPEPFVCIAACHAIADLCRGAGDFLATRISVEWADLHDLAKRTKHKAALERKGVYGRGIFSQISQVWEAVIILLIAIVGHVRIDDEAFDDALQVLGNLAWEREDIRAVMESFNSDSVWLAMHRSGRSRTQIIPVLERHQFVALDA